MSAGTPPPRAPRRRAGAAAAGFTLIEIVIAVAVVSISVIAAFSVLSQAAFGTAHMQERTLASWIALNRIAELRLQPAFPEIGRSDGDVEFGPAEWVWEAEVIATQVESLRRIEVSVKRDRDADPITTVVGFVGDPAARLAGQPTPWSVPGAGADGQPGGLPDGEQGESLEEALDNLGISP